MGCSFNCMEENEGRAMRNSNSIQSTPSPDPSSSLGAEPGEGGGVDESQSCAGSNDLGQIGIGGPECAKERPQWRGLGETMEGGNENVLAGLGWAVESASNTMWRDFVDMYTR